MTARAFITAVGARSPLGLSSLQVAMSARAAKIEPRSTDFLDRHGNRIGACRMRGLPDDLHGPGRFVAIGAPALAEALHDAPGGGPIPCFLALPDAKRADQAPATGRREGFEAAVVDGLVAASRGRISSATTTVVRADNAGAALAIAAGLDALDRGAPAAVVGGVDSYFDPLVLHSLDDERRLYSIKGDGILPSEAAAFLRLTPRHHPDAFAYAAIADVVRADEPTEGTDEPSLAAAMTDVLRRAAAASPGGAIAWLLSDWNGERHRVAELQRATSRVGDELAEALHDRFVEEVGDVGAATGALLAVIACRLFRAGCAPAASCTIALAAEGPARAGIVLEEVR